MKRSSPMTPLTPPASVAVFRALHLGDLLCAVPALRALKSAWPRARVTLIGLPWAQELLGRFPGYVDDFIEFPGFPGLPERDCDAPAVVEFLQSVQRQRFDLALQLHDSGEISNPLVALLGARRIGGFYRAGQFCPDAATFVPWRDDESEVERGVRLLAALGAPARGLELEAPVLPADRDALAALAHANGLERGAYVCVHPGAQLPSRRWYPERFAVVADQLAARGLSIVLTGTRGEASLARRVTERMLAPAVDLVGRTTLGAFTALIDGARLVVANDTGVRHVAAARGTPCVAVACGSDPRRWPPSRSTQRLLSAPVACRPCLHVRCPVGHACAHGVESRDVLEAAEELLTLAAGAAEPSTCAA